LCCELTYRGILTTELLTACGKPLEATTHQDVPFETLLEVLQIPRDPSRTPLFQVAFASSPVPRLQVPGFEATYLALDRQRVNYDLTFWLNEQLDRVNASLEFNTDLFDRGTIRQFLANYNTLLKDVVRDPGRPLGRLNMVADAVREQWVERWNQTRRDFAPQDCVHRLFEAQAA
jgi:non-ribosomal peptide synthetase component F